MPIIDFPSIEDADENGLVAIGGDLHPQSLLLAYSKGIFPWPVGPEYPLAWFSPDPRGVIKCSDMHIPRKLKKELRKQNLKVTFNKNFRDVIEICSIVHENSDSGTWITDEIKQGYIDFHEAGHAYSIEVWNEENLVGGLYGVVIGNFISGESMFHKETNASKLALITLLYNLKLNDVLQLDTQMVTNITKSIGATEVKRSDFLKNVQTEIKKPKLIFENFITDIKHLYAVKGS